MAVEKIEEYRQQNGVDILKVILKPTVKFPIGYFYAPANAVDLVSKYIWFLQACGKNQIRVIANDNDSAHYEAGRLHRDTVLFHAKLFEFYNNYKWQDSIDHINLIEIDNIDDNLNAVNQSQNCYNKLTRGYQIATHLQPAIFTARSTIDGKRYFLFKADRDEADACQTQNYVEQVWLRDKLGTQYYMFNFLKYRRGSEDLLDLERTGIISEEEATYRHILKYSQNAWFYLRYGLQDYFQQYHIPVPQYKLDDMGFMRHPVTNQLLCPFH